MFESVSVDSVPELLRDAAIAPMAAFLFAQLFFSILPILGRVPEVAFWIVEAILLAGTLIGAIAIGRVVRSASMRGRAAAWLIVVLAAEALCARLFLSMTFPWL